MSLKTLPRKRLAVAIATAAVLALAPVAGAATDTTQFGVTAGTLQLLGNPDVPDLGTITLNGTQQTTNGTMSGWQARDATGSGSGWNLNVQGDPAGGKSAVFKEYCTNAVAPCSAIGYVAGGATLAANSLTLVSTGAGFSADNGSPAGANLPTHSCSTACNVDSAATVKVASAAANAGMGTFTANSYSGTSLALSTPANLKAQPSNKVYRVDLLWTLSTGP